MICYLSRDNFRDLVSHCKQVVEQKLIHNRVSLKIAISTSTHIIHSAIQ